MTYVPILFSFQFSGAIHFLPFSIVLQNGNFKPTMAVDYASRVPEEKSRLNSLNELHENIPINNVFDPTYDYRPERTIGEIRRFDGKKWIRKDLQMKSDSTCHINLHRGGQIKVHSNMINPFDLIEVEEELMEHPELFREYPIQGGREPRANLFFHEKATDDGTVQPGYKYRSTRMKAISYKGFPSLEGVSKRTAKHCSVPYWNIGVNAVCYRDGNDSIGYHADNDQGEDKILSKFHCSLCLSSFYCRHYT
jgi:alkylated DNA repair dioxygenase AlkB